MTWAGLGDIHMLRPKMMCTERETDKNTSWAAGEHKGSGTTFCASPNAAERILGDRLARQP